MPSDPASIEHRGSLALHFFEPSKEWPGKAVLITDGTQFLLLTGRAADLARDIADTFVSLTAQPELVQRQHKATTNDQGCISSVPYLFDRVSTASRSGVRDSLVVRSGIDSSSFGGMGLVEQDDILAVNGQPARDEDELSILSKAAKGERVVLTIVRASGDRIDLPMRPEAARAALASCSH